ncbi:MAG: hypothetical protein KatS3mg025_0119 [Bacteroidia bacterium]|nr:MAG: hypothetical protein KatS3mg025_0119 [Bacteroidia bacterium]
MKVLRLRLLQPSALYRVPYAYQKILTYPLPPYATVLGFLTNWLGNDPDVGLSLPLEQIAVAGRWESVVPEYTWARNLAKEEHENYFGAVAAPAGRSSKRALRRPSRMRWGLPEHPGGQSPRTSLVLQKIELLLYLGTKTPDHLSLLKKAFYESQPHEILHLGRAEDLVIPLALEEVILRKGDLPPSKLSWRFWIPWKEMQRFPGLRGTPYRVALWAQDKPPARQVKTVPVFLWEGDTPYPLPDVYIDENYNLPVFWQKL